MTVLATKNSAASAAERKTEATEWAGLIALNTLLAKRNLVAVGRRLEAMTVLAMMNSAANAAERRTNRARTTRAAVDAGRRSTTAAFGRPSVAITLATKRTMVAANA